MPASRARPAPTPKPMLRGRTSSAVDQTDSAAQFRVLVSRCAGAHAGTGASISCREAREAPSGSRRQLSRRRPRRSRCSYRSLDNQVGPRICRKTRLIPADKEQQTPSGPSVAAKLVTAGAVQKAFVEQITPTCSFWAASPVANAVARGIMKAQEGFPQDASRSAGCRCRHRSLTSNLSSCRSSRR